MPNYPAMKTNREMRLEIQAILIPEPDGGDWLAS